MPHKLNATAELSIGDDRYFRIGYVSFFILSERWIFLRTRSLHIPLFTVAAVANFGFQTAGLWGPG
jgi:hypothetical protein